MFRGAIAVGESRTQGDVSLSDTEAEYVAIGEVTKWVLSMRGILKFVSPDVKEKFTTNFEDN